MGTITAMAQAQLPADAFPNMDRQGKFMLNQQIGILGNGFPLTITFDPSLTNTGGYLGPGWCLSPFESYAVMTDDHTFKAIMPDGRTVYFRRSGSDPTRLVGSGPWSATLTDTVFTAEEPNGLKVIFQDGKLQSFQSNGQNFIVTQDNGSGKIADDSGHTWADVRKASNEEVQIDLGQDMTMKLKLTTRPIIQSQNNSRVVGAVVPTLASIDSKIGLLSFNWAVDTTTLTPTLTEQGPNQQVSHFTWNPADSQLLSDDKYKYKVLRPSTGYWDFASIQRTDVNGKSETYDIDWSKATSTVTAPDGTVHQSNWYDSGDFYGYVRTVTETKGKQTVMHKYSYDQNGLLLRVTDQANASP